MAFNSKDVIEHNRKTAIGRHNGTFDYPSSKGLGVDRIQYQRRNPHPAERSPLPVSLKMKDLPGLIVRDLQDAARKGELPAELKRHIDLCEANQYMDTGTIKMLRGYERDLLGHPDYDADQLDTISDVIMGCAPSRLRKNSVGRLVEWGLSEGS